VFWGKIRCRNFTGVYFRIICPLKSNGIQRYREQINLHAVFEKTGFFPAVRIGVKIICLHLRLLFRMNVTSRLNFLLFLEIGV